MNLQKNSQNPEPTKKKNKRNPSSIKPLFKEKIKKKGLYFHYGNNTHWTDSYTQPAEVIIQTIIFSYCFYYYQYKNIYKSYNESESNFFDY